MERALGRHAFTPQFQISCSANERKTTVAVVSASTPDQMQTGFTMASRVLRPASQLNNSARLVVFGSMLSRVPAVSSQVTRFLGDVAQRKIDAIPGATLDGVDLVIASHDLSVLRFLDCEWTGQLCAVREEALEAAIECLVRPIDVDYSSVSDLPEKWAEYVRATSGPDSKTGLRYFKDLWAETHKKSDSVPDSNPPKALTLAMFSKMAMLVGYTAPEHVELVEKVVRETPGAVGLGLLSAFPVADERRSCIDFIKNYVVDNPPWTLNQRGEEACKAADSVLKAVFAHADAVASVLKWGKLAVVVGPKAGVAGSKDGIVLIDSGDNGTTGKLLAGSVPSGVELVENKFSMVLKKELDAEKWSSALNAIVPKAIDALKDESKNEKGTRSLLGVLMALSSSDLYVPRDLSDSEFDDVLSKRMQSSISTHPSGFSSHISHELVIHSNRIECISSGAHVGLQHGACVACTFATYCPTTGRALATNSFAPVGLKNLDVVETQRVVDEIASSIDKPYRPIGSLFGVLGPVVEKNGEPCRVIYWRRKNESRDSVITFMPSAYTDVVFADYATRSRNLVQSESELEGPRGAHASHGHDGPTFAADTVFSLSTSSAIKGTGGRVFTIPRLDQIGFFGQDERQLYRSFETGVVDSEVNTELPSALDGSFQTFFVRESTSDALCGIKVGWAKVGDSFALVSQNGAHERVSY